MSLIPLVVYVKKVGSLKIVIFKTDEKALLEQIMPNNIHLEMRSHSPTKEEMVIPLGKAERFPQAISQIHVDYLKK
jgi:hypothetical protein